MTSGFATLAELQTIYGVEDLYDFLEISSINAHNTRVLAARKS